MNAKNSARYRHDIPDENHKKILKKLANKKQRDKKIHYCPTCDVSRLSANDLKIHMDTDRHKLKQKCKDQLKDKFNEDNFKIWKKNQILIDKYCEILTELLGKLKKYI